MDFDLVTEWRIAAPIEPIWRLLRDVEGWPSWWPNVAEAVRLEAGDEAGIGAVHRLAWTTALPYRLVFMTRVVAIEPMRRIEAEAYGELDGKGTWSLEPDGEGVRVRYRWQVRPEKAWMRLLAPLLRPVFAWNHDKVMEAGRRGVVRRLSAEGQASGPLSSAPPSVPPSAASSASPVPFASAK